MTCFKEASWLRRPRLHPAFIFPEEAARRMHLPGSLLGVRPGSPGEAEGSAAAPLAPQRPARSQQLLLVVLRARGALAHLLIPLVGEGFHLDAPVVEVLEQRHNQALSGGQGQGQGRGGELLCTQWRGWEAGRMATGNLDVLTDNFEVLTD